MTYKTVAFDDHEVSVGNRPRTVITLHGPGGWYGKAWQAAAGLVDTGADYTLLPTQAAAAVASPVPAPSACAWPPPAARSSSGASW